MKSFVILLIAVLLAGCTGQLQPPVAPQTTPPPTPPKLYPALFGSTPTGATVTIMSLNSGTIIGTVTASPDTFRLPEGPYSCVATMNGYQTWFGSLYVTPGSGSVTNFTLAQTPVTPAIPTGTLSGPDSADVGVAIMLTLTSDAKEAWSNNAGPVIPGISYSVVFHEPGWHKENVQLWGLGTLPGSAERAIYVRGPQQTPTYPPSCSVTVDSSHVPAGTKYVTLHLKSTYGRYAALSGYPGFAPLNGDVTVALTEDQETFVFMVIGDPNYMPAYSAVIIMRGSPTPTPKPTVQITASPTSIMPGDLVGITATSTNADVVILMPSGKYFPNNGNGSVIEYPTRTTVYYAIAVGPGGVAQSNTVTVTAANTLPPANSPTLIAPAHGTTGLSTSPTLSWNAVSTATSYRAQLLDAQAGTVLRDTNVTGTSVLFSGLAAGTQYAWRVSARNQYGSGDWSAVWLFTTAGIAPVVKNPTAKIVSIPDTVDQYVPFQVTVASTNGISADFSYNGPVPLNGAFMASLTAVGRVKVYFRVDGQPGSVQAIDSASTYVRKVQTPPPVDTTTVSVWINVSPDTIYLSPGEGGSSMSSITSVNGVLWAANVMWGSRNADKVTIEGLPSQSGKETTVALSGQRTEYFAQTVTLVARGFRQGVLRATGTKLVTVIRRSS